MAPHKKYVLSLCAEADLIDIWGYTFSQWGEKQADRYIDALYERFSWLAENLQLGRQRPDVKEGYCCYLQGSHLIFYIISEAGIEVIGIMHKNMDVMSYFSLSGLLDSITPDNLHPESEI